MEYIDYSMQGICYILKTSKFLTTYVTPTYKIILSARLEKENNSEYQHKILP
jgi:hypothetical protein